MLLLIPVAAIVIAFRAYTSQHARHQHLEFLYDSMRTTRSAQDFDAAVKILLAARRMLRAEFAELVLLPERERTGSSKPHLRDGGLDDADDGLDARQAGSPWRSSRRTRAPSSCPSAMPGEIDEILISRDSRTA